MITAPRNTDPRVEGLIKRLYWLADNADKVSSARTALAELRRGLRDDPRDQLRVGKYVVPFLDDKPNLDEPMFFLVASLFASHPRYRDNVSLGHAFHEIKESSDSIESRFLALLATPAPRLRVPLRNAVALLATTRNAVPIDWSRLLYDLLQWDYPRKTVQHRWARHFYQGPQPDNAAPDSNDTNPKDPEHGETDLEN